MGLLDKFKKKSPLEIANEGLRRNRLDATSKLSTPSSTRETGEKDIIRSLLAGPYCINCGLLMPCRSEDVCPRCGQNQKRHVQKQSTNPRDMAYQVVSYCAMDEHQVISLFSELGNPLTGEARSQVPAIFTLFNLGIASVWYLAHYEENPKRDEIVKCLQEVMHDYLLDTWGADKFGTATDYMISVVEEVEVILRREKGKHEEVVTSIVKALQKRSDSVIMGVNLPGDKFCIPSIHMLTVYHTHVCSFLPPLTAMLRKWEIK